MNPFYRCLSLFTSLVPVRLVEILIWVIQSNPGLSLQTVRLRSRTFSLGLHTWVATKASLETGPCGKLRGWCGRWRQRQLRRLPQKDVEGTRQTGRYAAGVSISPTWPLFLHLKAMSFPDQTQTLPFPRTEEVMRVKPVFSKRALIGAIQCFNIHYLQSSDAPKVWLLFSILRNIQRE